jgi:hypothetical protein
MQFATPNREGQVVPSTRKTTVVGDLWLDIALGSFSQTLSVPPGNAGLEFRIRFAAGDTSVGFTPKWRLWMVKAIIFLASKK